MVILHCGGAMISQMQFLLLGEMSGKDGLVIVPFAVSIIPPHAFSHLLSSECNSYPILQEQLYPPRVLIHSCSQPWSGEWHSSYSFMKLAENPAFWTEPSETNLIQRLFDVDLMSFGILYPQKVPIRSAPDVSPSLISR